MLAAAFFPAPIALITVALPVTISPPAKTSDKEDCPLSLTSIYPHLLSFKSFVFLVKSGLAFAPIAIIHRSTSIIYSDPGIAIGLLRPDASGSPNSIFKTSIALTKPSSSPMIFVGFLKKWNSTPSSTACSYSSRRAGISFSLLRYTIMDFSAPSRNAVRALSIATLPPPNTATFFPRSTIVS